MHTYMYDTIMGKKTPYVILIPTYLILHARGTIQQGIVSAF